MIAGLAPFVHQSGTHRGQTRVGGGRAWLRRALFMPAMVGATRCNPVLWLLCKRLTRRGKPGSALIACARKLPIIANAAAARGTPWQDRRAAVT